eukprot:gnl/Dysnectes_brevis/4079_a5348_996.p1 GENE.gnl/Dysnectes_brevis/4079_a5348_996~~gnl/Dysnectes_brevis/4079_a5348_996.p1  ORF type:complete len:191 (+),score=7.11 gnl/Dysnectes_brevis/4079_a5348_996:31-603(+)
MKPASSNSYKSFCKDNEVLIADLKQSSKFFYIAMLKTTESAVDTITDRPFPYSMCFFGRHADNDITFAEKAVSRRHSVIFWKDDQPHILDFSPYLHSTINGVPINPHEPVALNNADLITICKKRFAIFTEEPVILDDQEHHAISHRVDHDAGVTTISGDEATLCLPFDQIEDAVNAHVRFAEELPEEPVE